MVRKPDTDQLHVDLPAELKQAARDAAAAADMTLGQWVRAVIRDRLARTPAGPAPIGPSFDPDGPGYEIGRASGGGRS